MSLAASSLVTVASQVACAIDCASSDNFVIIAHRGGAGLAPENTFPAFDNALDMGFEHIEMDVQMTEDGVPVVYHDSYMNKKTELSGLVGENSFADIRSLDFGTWFGEEFAGTQIPTLAEVLERYRDRATFHLELKRDDGRLPEAVVVLLSQTGWLFNLGNRDDPERGAADGWMRSGLVVTSFEKDSLVSMRKLVPEVHISWLVRDVEQRTLDDARDMDFDMVCPPVSHVTPEAVARIRESGLSMRAWGYEKPEDLSMLVKAGAGGITVDRPDLAWRYLVENGLIAVGSDH